MWFVFIYLIRVSKWISFLFLFPWWKYLKSFYHDVIIFRHWTCVLYSETKDTFKSDNEVYVTQFILRILCHKIVHAVLNLTERDLNLKFLHSNIMSHHNDQLYSNYTGWLKLYLSEISYHILPAKYLMYKTLNILLY